MIDLFELLGIALIIIYLSKLTKSKKEINTIIEDSYRKGYDDCISHMYNRDLHDSNLPFNDVN